MTSKPKVICLGLGRTGTTSLMAALDHLGFGPCYHMRTILGKWDPEEIRAWYNLGQGLSTLDDLRNLLKDYNSILDYPPAIYYDSDKLYEAYPDAKFLLTTRDPAKWEASMKATILQAIKKFHENTKIDQFKDAMIEWCTIEMEGRYHQNRLYTETQKEIVRHNQRVMDTIPADKLLVYEVSQGWDPLVKFLGVDKPDIPFPHANDTASFQTEIFPMLSSGQHQQT